MPNQAYRLRIRNAADSADALVLTSIAGGTNPYIASPPSGDGQEVDLLTGAVRTGAYVIEVVDVATGTDATGTIRVLTNQLYDGSGTTARPHLLSRRAYVEMSSDGGGSWTAWCAGYVSNIRQIDAIRYAVTVSNTRRVEQTKQVFTWQTAAERLAFPKRGCIYGGPVIGGLGGGTTRTIDSGGWEYKYKATTGTSSPVAGDTLALKYDFGFFYPLFERKQVPGPEQNTQWWRSVRPYLKQVSGDASASGVEFTYLRRDQVYAMPDLTVIVTDPATGNQWLGEVRAIDVGPSQAVAAAARTLFQQRTNLYVKLYAPETSWPTLPSADTTLRVRVVTRQVSEASPLYLQAHPADIAKSLYELATLTVNTTSYNAVKAALGANLTVTYRLPAAETMAEFLETSLFGPFGFSARVNGTGEVEFFSTRVLNYTAPTYTIATADLVGDEPPVVYDIDESTVVTGFTLTQQVLVNATDLDTDEGEPAPDGIYGTEQTLEYASGDTSTYATRVVSYNVPGMVTDAESFVPTFEAWSRGVVYEGFERFGRGAVVSEVAVLRTAASAAAQVGDFVTLDVSYYPNRNYRIGEAPSIGARVAQVVRREERPESVLFKLVDAGGFVQPGTAATVSLAASTSDPRRVAQFTITNAATLNSAGTIAVAVEWARGASTPTGNGNLFTRYEPGEIPTGPVALPGVRLGGQTVYVRVRSEQSGIFPSAWTGWQSVTLNAWTAPTGVTVGTLTNETVAVSWSLNTNTVDPVDIYVAPGSVAPSDWTSYRVNTLPEGTTSTLLTGLTASTAYIVGVAFRDRVANVAMTPVTATFTTAGTTTGTADRPAGLQVMAGVDDASLPQGVILAIWPSAGAVSTVLERAPNVAGVPGTYAELAVLPGTVTSYVDYLPKDGTTYWYRIKHRTAGKTDSAYIPAFTSPGPTTYQGVNAVATGVPPVQATVLPQEPIIVPSSAYINVGSPQFNLDLTYTDPQHRIAFFELRDRSRTTKTWGAWSAWTGYNKDVASRTSGTFSSITGLATTTTIYQVEWRVYGADAFGNLSYIRSGTTEWPQNYGQNKPIIKVQKQGYNAGTGKYEVWWRFYFDRGNSTLDEDGDQNTQQTFTTQVIATSVKDQTGATATNVVTSGTKTIDGWKATWDSTAGQSWVFEVSVDTAMPTQYYLQYQDTDVLDEQFVTPTSGQTFSAPAASATATTGTLTLGTYLTGGSYNGSTNVTTTVDATSTNTASKVVARDASGDFAAGTITATLNGAAPAGSLTGTTLASNVVTSSLTSVGTLTGLTVSGASPSFNTGNSVGTLTLGTTAAVTQEQRFRLTNSVATGGVELVLNSAATAWGLYDRTASKWAVLVTRGATDAVSIPGSLAVTDALSTSSTLQASRYAAVGGAVSANSQFYVRGTMVGTGVNQYGALVQTTFPVAATSSMQGVYVQQTGADGTYTTTDVVGVNVQAFALGAGQTVTNAYGVFIGGSSHAATTKYGIQIGSVTGGTTNYALYTGAGQVRLGDDLRIISGSLSLTTIPSKTTVAIQVNTDHALLTSATSYGMLMSPTAQGTVTNYRAIEARVVISATTALTNAFGVFIRTPTITAGGTIATNYGLQIEAQTGATTNYAIYTNAGLVRFGDAVSVVGNVNLSSGSAFQINSTNVLTATALGTGVTASSLTSVGTIGTGVWQGSAVGVSYGGTGATSYGTTGSGTRVIVYDIATNVLEAVPAGASGQFLQSSGTAGDVLWATPPNFSTASTTAGYVPGSNGVGTSYFLRADGTWAIPAVGSVSANNVTSGTFSGATYTFSNSVTFSSGVRVALGETYKILNGGGTAVDVLSATTLGSGVVNSSLTSVGTLTSLTVSGDLTVDTSTLKVDSTNNRVGIGTTSPAYTLDAAGYINGTNLLRSTRDASQRIDIDCGGPSYPTSSGIVSFAHPTNSKTLVIRATTDASNTTRTGGSLGIDFQTYASSRLYISEFGNVGVATVSPEGQVDIPWSGTAGKPTILLGATDGGGTRTNATQKNFRIGAYHYTNASTPYAVLMGNSDASNNEVRIGGGTGLLNAATSISMYTGATTTTATGTARLVINSSGNVGIGTTAPTSRIHGVGPSASDVTYRLEPISNSYKSTLYISSVSSGDGGFRYDASANQMNQFSYGDMIFNVGTANISGAIGNERLRITQSGNVGIGTTSPAHRLQLGTSSSGANIGLYSSSYGNDGLARFYGTSGSEQMQIGAFASNVVGIYAFAGSGLDLYSNGAVAIKVLTSGNVGIGTTSPGSKLHVYGDPARIQIQSSSRSWMIGTDNSPSGLYLAYDLTAGASRVFVDNLGNVGIGTTSPAVHSGTNSALVVRGAGTSRGIIEVWDGNGTGKAVFQQVGGTTYIGNLGGAGDLILLTNGTGTSALEAVTLKASGNVGIGTTSPGSRLSVVGSTNGALPLVDLTASGTDAFMRGVRMLNSGMVNGSSMMYAVGRSDNARNMGQFYFAYVGDGSTSNRISIGLHSVDDVVNILGTGSVGIGTTSPSIYAKLHVAGSNKLLVTSTSGGWGQLQVANTSDGECTQAFAAGGSGSPGNDTTYTRQWIWGINPYGVGQDTFALTNKTLTSSAPFSVKEGGDVLINGSGWAGSRLQVNESSGPTAEINGTSNTAAQSPLYVWNNVESGSTYFISFYSDGQLNPRTLRGYINYRRDNATMNLTTASDYRIKTIHGPYTKSGEVFDKIRMHEGTITGESGKYPMVLAHELAEAYPSAVEGEKDAVNEDGTPKLQMVSYTAMIPLMLAEIKSLRARVAALES